MYCKSVKYIRMDPSLEANWYLRFSENSKCSLFLGMLERLIPLGDIFLLQRICELILGKCPKNMGLNNFRLQFFKHAWTNCEYIWLIYDEQTQQFLKKKTKSHHISIGISRNIHRDRASIAFPCLSKEMSSHAPRCII